MLPPDIRVYEFIPVVPKANAQLDATARTYRYYFHLHRNPFWEEGSRLPTRDKIISISLKLIEIFFYYIN